jgi:sulfur-carrier protein
MVVFWAERPALKMTSMINVQVRYFASLRESLGASQKLQMPAGSTVGLLRDHLATLGGEHARCLDRQRAVRCALDQVMVDEGAALLDGCEVAFFPPVTGG